MTKHIVGSWFKCLSSQRRIYVRVEAEEGRLELDYKGFEFQF